MPGIYCFKNLTNGKCYIGQAKDLRKRQSAYKYLWEAQLY